MIILWCPSIRSRTKCRGTKHRRLMRSRHILSTQPYSRQFIVRQFRYQFEAQVGYNTATKRGYPMERIFPLIGSLGFTFSLFHYFIFSFTVICFSFIFNLSPDISFISYNFKVGALSKLCLALLFSLSLQTLRILKGGRKTRCACSRRLFLFTREDKRLWQADFIVFRIQGL